MKLEDVKIGMKVKLLGKHAGFRSDYNNIEDWFKDCYAEEVRQIKEQGYAVVTYIDENDIIWISDCIDGQSWSFTLSDLESCEEELTGESTSIKTPKEWLLTPMVTFITRNGYECITLGKGVSCVIEPCKLWDDELDEDYDNDLNYIRSNNSRFDIMSITYEGNVVWKRKEYMTLTDAIKTGKNIKHKSWRSFIYPTDAMLLLSDKGGELINLFTNKVWEVE